MVSWRFSFWSSLQIPLIINIAVYSHDWCLCTSCTWDIHPNPTIIGFQEKIPRTPHVFDGKNHGFYLRCSLFHQCLLLYPMTYPHVIPISWWSPRKTTVKFHGIRPNSQDTSRRRLRSGHVSRAPRTTSGRPPMGFAQNPMEPAQRENIRMMLEMVEIGT